MNNPEKAGEPSMDEILASIRKIIAEEPSDMGADAEGTPNPLFTGTALRNDPSEKPFELNDRPRPSLDRLSSALKARAMSPPAPPPATKQPPSFSAEPPPSLEDDLSDILDVPLPVHPFANGRPKLNPLASLAGKDDARSAASAKEIVVDATNESLSAEIDQVIDAVMASGHTEVNGKPESASSHAEDADGNFPPPPQAKPAPLSPWDAMRKKSGYWPPQSASPSASTSPSTVSQSSAVNGAFVPGSGPFPPKEVQQAHSSAPQSTADLVARLQAGLSDPASPSEPEPPLPQFSVPPGASAPAQPMPYAAEPHINGSYTNGSSYTSEPRVNGMGYAYSPAPPPPNNFVPPYPSARAAEPPPIPQTPAPDPYVRPLSTDAIMNAALEALMNGGKASPLNLDPFARTQPQADTSSPYQAPYGQGNYSTSTYSTYASYEPDPTTAAAAAFDALAQGLAASSRSEPRHAYDYQQPAAPSPSHTALVAQPLLPVVQEYHPQAIRTLEDAVAEMLKPMLQRWLSDNMPRIIERALRFEAASGMKPPNSQ